jgi:hypothetical protein
MDPESSLNTKFHRQDMAVGSTFDFISSTSPPGVRLSTNEQGKR